MPPDGLRWLLKTLDQATNGSRLNLSIRSDGNGQACHASRPQLVHDLDYRMVTYVGVGIHDHHQLWFALQSGPNPGSEVLQGDRLLVEKHLPLLG